MRNRIQHTYELRQRQETPMDLVKSVAFVVALFLLAYLFLFCGVANAQEEQTIISAPQTIAPLCAGPCEESR